MKTIKPRVALAMQTDSPIDRTKVRNGATRTIYIGLRHGRRQHCKGLSIRAFDFTPEEVHRIIVRALEAEAEKVQRIARTKAS